MQIRPFFIEILLVVFFLVVFSVAVSQAYVATNTTAKKNTDIQFAMIAAQITVEILRSVKSPADAEQAFGKRKMTGQGETSLIQYSED